MLCKASDGTAVYLCQACLNSLPWHQQYCPQCALPTPAGQLCGKCIASPPDFDSTQALFRYAYPVSGLLQQYKYADALHLAQTFAQLMHERFTLPVDNQADNCLIIPMPLHPSRLQERGFNQALEIAKSVSKLSGISLDFVCCQRVKPSPPQATLSLKERVKNVRGAFACRNSLAGKSVMIIDDVMTTGATMNALSVAIKAAGAQQVACMVVARTL